MHRSLLQCSGAELWVCARMWSTHAPLPLAVLEQAPTAVVAKGQVCGQVTQEPDGHPRASLHAQSKCYRPLETFWLWCSSCTECWLPASRLPVALAWAKTASVPLVQPGQLSWCLLVLLCCMRLPPITRQRSMNPSRCSKWRSDIFMWELLHLEWREELIGIFCNLALISACFCPKLRPQPLKRDECFSKNTETYHLKSFSE